MFRRAISVPHLNHMYIGHHSSLETYINLNEQLIRQLQAFIDIQMQSNNMGINILHVFFLSPHILF